MSSHCGQGKTWSEEQLDFVLQLGGAKPDEEVAALFNDYFRSPTFVTAEEIKSIRSKYRLRTYHPRR
jgi:hypothetical protein